MIQFNYTYNVPNELCVDHTFTDGNTTIETARVFFKTSFFDNGEGSIYFRFVNLFFCSFNKRFWINNITRFRN